MASTKTVKERFVEKIDMKSVPGHWLWTGAVNNEGYGLAHDGTKMISAHRLAFTLSGKKELLPGQLVLHARGCPSKMCVSPACLRAGDTKANVADAKAVGAMNKPHKKPRPICEQERKSILDTYAAGASLRSIAKRFGRDRRHIYRIVNGLSPNPNGKRATRAREEAKAKQLKIDLRREFGKIPDLLYFNDLPECQPYPLIPDVQEWSTSLALMANTALHRLPPNDQDSRKRPSNVNADLAAVSFQRAAMNF
jgi:transposase